MNKYVPTFEEFHNEHKEVLNEQKYDFGCSMIFFDFPQMKEIHSSINKSDLHENGLEDEPHVTLLYGIHSDEVSDDDILNASTSIPIESIQLGNLSLFENDEFDVLKFDADASELSKINKKLVEFPNTNNFPDYHPHCTVAYLKPGEGKKYAEKFKGMTHEVFPTKVVYSKPSGEKVF
jgi:2'-5' RNA ligase